MTAGFGFEDDAWLAKLRAAAGTPAVVGEIAGYELLGPAGRGGQGAVYKARQPGTGRLVAIKRVWALDGIDAGRAGERFRREVELAASLRHPSIVTVHGLVEDGRALVMEWIDGRPMDAWADAERGAPDGLRRIVRAVRSACEAVAFAHGRGVIHRDLKPANVLVEAGPAAVPAMVKVLDFGLARDLSAADATMTLRGQFAGTPVYAPPEQIDRGLHEADVRADVYAMGALLFRVLTGRDAFEAPTLAALFDRIRRGGPPAPSAINPRIDRELDAIVLLAMRPRPEERYTTMAELAEDLARWLERRAVRAHAPTTLYLARAFVRRHRTVVGLAALAVMLILGFGIAAGATAWSLARQKAALKATIGERDGALGEARLQRADADAQRSRIQRELTKTISVNMAMLLVLERSASGDGDMRERLARAFGDFADGLGTRMYIRPDHEAAMRLHLGTVFKTLGDRGREAEQIDLAVRLARERMPDSSELANALGEAGRIALEAGRFEEAAALLAECVALARRVFADPDGMGEGLLNLIESRVRLGQAEEAQRLVDGISEPTDNEFLRRAAASRLSERCDQLGLRKPPWVERALTPAPSP